MRSYLLKIHATARVATAKRNVDRGCLSFEPGSNACGRVANLHASALVLVEDVSTTEAATQRIYDAVKSGELLIGDFYIIQTQPEKLFVGGGEEFREWAAKGADKVLSLDLTTEAAQ